MHLHTLEAHLSRCGWQLNRVRGSHRHYRNTCGQLLTVTAHGKRTFSAREFAQVQCDMRQRHKERTTTGTEGREQDA